MSCAVGQRHGSDLALLWLWCRLAAAAQIQPPAWERPHATPNPPPQKKKGRWKTHFFLSGLVSRPSKGSYVQQEGMARKAQLVALKEAKPQDREKGSWPLDGFPPETALDSPAFCTEATP